MTMGLRKSSHLFLTLILALFGTSSSIPTTDVEDESKFPDSLPNEAWAYEVVWFEQEPQHSFIIKNKPATLTCVVASALKVYFKCNGKVVPNSKQIFHSSTHENTGATITRVEYNVSRKEVEDRDGAYSCECVGWNKRGSERSQTAQIQIAFLKKHFEVGPYSQNIELNSETEFRCIPPEGTPVPTISWLRDGTPLSTSQEESHFIVTADGHLLIAQTRLSDMGNYSCVAENVANTRVSDPALLTVYVNGGWSGWGSWGECSGVCGKGYQKRTRFCNNPPPLNGGRPCPNLSYQKQDCFLPCPPVDGKWSSWQPSSTCDENCKQTKRRVCNNPPPSHGGKNCTPGKDNIVANCTGGLCKDVPIDMVPYGNSGGVGVTDLKTQSSNSDQATRAVSDGDFVLYVGLSAGIITFTIIAFISIRLMRRKGRDNIMYDMAPSDYPPGYFVETSRKLCMQPDLTVTTSSGGSSHSGRITTTNSLGLPYEYSYPSSNNSHKDNPPLTPDTSEHLYDVPHVHNLKKSFPKSPNSSSSPEDNTKNSFRLLRTNSTPSKKLNNDFGHLVQKSPKNIKLENSHVSDDEEEELFCGLNLSPELVQSPNGPNLISSNVPNGGKINNEMRLPEVLKRRLGEVLDPTHPTGKDWRLLAHKLGVERYTNFVKMRESPTEYILDLWESKNKTNESWTDLLNALRLMGRHDAVSIFENEMSLWT